MPFMVGRLTCLETLPLFAVGPDRGGSIQELECLNNLRGSLRLEYLEEVRDKDEAEKANLQKKTKIEDLKFVWSNYGREDLGNDEQVLEGLQPHAGIKSLEVKGYLGEKFPLWLLTMRVQSRSDSSTILNNLVKLNLINCIRCKELPRLGHLPHLEVLTIGGLDNVKYIGSEFYGIIDRTLFPSLKSFEMMPMESLEEWMAPTIGDQGSKIIIFPCLKELTIWECHWLKKIPMKYLSSFEILDIRDCEELSNIFDEIHESQSLVSLRINCCHGITCVPSDIRSCTSLQVLEISHCDKLTTVSQDLGNVSSLVGLDIRHCPRLSHFPEEILPRLIKLKRLEIGGFSEELVAFPYLNSIRFGDFPSLEELKIHGGTSVYQLPDQLQRLAALKSLFIWDFSYVEALPEWLGNLCSLQRLSFENCEKIRCLPTAEAIQRISNLKNLYIYGSPYLAESCAEGSGSEWYKISHIQHITIY